MLRSDFVCIVMILTMTSTLGAQGLSEKRNITVSGDATVYVVPDEVSITMGIESHHKKLAEAQAANHASITSVLAYLRGLEIPEKHIKTDYIYINPEYTYKDGEEHLIGYIVRKNIVVTLKDLKKFDGMIAGILDKGINTIHNINFRTSELRKHRDKARDMAVRAAREKAEAMAGALGSSLAYVTDIQEQDTRWWNYYNSGWGGSSRAMTQNAMQNAGGNSPSATSTAPGQIAVDARVRISFALQRGSNPSE
jgi:uncharacterized protein